jgi:GH18 family chitinase
MKRTQFFVLTICSLFILLATSCKKDINQAAGGKTAPRALTAASSFKVMGYLPDWAGDVTQVQYSKLTHLCYAFMIPNSDGSLQGIDQGRLASMVSLGHAAGTRILISVGGGGGGGGFAGIVASATNRTNFVNNLLSFCSKNNVDGVDIDWEYPSAGTQANNFLTMMQQLSTALHNQGKLLSVAVIGEDGDYIVNGIFPVVDIVMVMAYDDNNFLHSTYELGTQCLAYWLNRGATPSECVLGVPFYGHDSSQDPNSDVAEVNYNVILSRGADPNQDVFSTYGYNGIRTMKSKTSYAMANCGGVGIWDLSGDATGSNSLLSAINTVVTAGGTLSTGAPVGTSITLKGFNSLYVSGEDGTKAMTCTRPAPGTWETFLVVDAGYGKVALRSMNLFVSSEDGLNPITCNRTSFSTWESFDWMPLTSGQVTLRGTNSLFISSENGTKSMTCNRSTASGWETFGVNQ